MRRYSNASAVGRIRSRLLVNATVDPDEAQLRLPDGLRAHVTDGSVVIGCCLLDIVDIRPTRVRALPGLHLQAAAHRISITQPDGSVGVFVPARLTNARTARALGGRVFPGVHRAAKTSLRYRGDRLDWSVEPRVASHAGVRVSTHSIGEPAEVCPTGSGVCIHATVGYSPGFDGSLESASMFPSHRTAYEVVIDDLQSDFIDSFASARLAASFLMRDVEVMWR